MGRTAGLLLPFLAVLQCWIPLAAAGADEKHLTVEFQGAWGTPVKVHVDARNVQDLSDALRSAVPVALPDRLGFKLWEKSSSRWLPLSEVLFSQLPSAMKSPKSYLIVKVTTAPPSLSLSAPPPPPPPLLRYVCPQLTLLSLSLSLCHQLKRT